MVFLPVVSMIASLPATAAWLPAKCRVNMARVMDASRIFRTAGHSFHIFFFLKPLFHFGHVNENCRPVACRTIREPPAGVGVVRVYEFANQFHCFLLCWQVDLPSAPTLVLVPTQSAHRLVAWPLGGVHQPSLRDCWSHGHQGLARPPKTATCFPGFSLVSLVLLSLPENFVR